MPRMEDFFFCALVHICNWFRTECVSTRRIALRFRCMFHQFAPWCIKYYSGDNDEVTSLLLPYIFFVYLRENVASTNAAFWKLSVFIEKAESTTFRKCSCSICVIGGNADCGYSERFSVRVTRWTITMFTSRLSIFFPGTSSFCSSVIHNGNQTCSYASVWFHYKSKQHYWPYLKIHYFQHFCQGCVNVSVFLN